MVIPLLVIVAIAFILYQFRSVFIRIANSQRRVLDPNEVKIFDDLDIKRVCPQCGDNMERGKAFVHFWSRDTPLSFETQYLFRSYPGALPTVSAANPFQRRMLGRKAHYCPRCQLFDLSPDPPANK